MADFLSSILFCNQVGHPRVEIFFFGGLLFLYYFSCRLLEIVFHSWHVGGAVLLKVNLHAWRKSSFLGTCQKNLSSFPLRFLNFIKSEMLGIFLSVPTQSFFYQCNSNKCREFMLIQMVRVRIQIVSFSFFLLLIKSIESQIKAFRIICYHSIIIWKIRSIHIRLTLRFVKKKWAWRQQHTLRKLWATVIKFNLNFLNRNENGYDSASLNILFNVIFVLESNKCQGFNCFTSVTQ